jgi:hypothetical protein
MPNREEPQWAIGTNAVRAAVWHFEEGIDEIELPPLKP